MCRKPAGFAVAFSYLAPPLSPLQVSPNVQNASECGGGGGSREIRNDANRAVEYSGAPPRKPHSTVPVSKRNESVDVAESRSDIERGCPDDDDVLDHSGSDKE
jgi:hypothetical protein